VLSQINKNSPPPIRGGGNMVVQDRKRSPQPRRAFTDYLTAGNAMYAPAEVEDSRLVATSLRTTRNRSTSGSSLKVQPATPAMNSLQKFPHSVDESQESQSPNLGHRQPYPSSETDLFQMTGIDSLGIPSTRDSAPIYPRQMGSPPIDYYNGNSSPRKRGLPHDYADWHSRDYGSLPYPDRDSYMYTPNSEDIHQSYDRKNYLGIFERDANAYLESGYTSQPMSRDASGESARGARRPSLAESEPAPKIPDFSPRVPTTSYQMYENMRERGNNGPMRRSPRLDFARARNTERINERSRPSDHSKGEKYVHSQIFLHSFH
jgi:hypothetical protein